MRELDDDERAILAALDAGVSDADLAAMLRDLAEILRVMSRPVSWRPLPGGLQRPAVQADAVGTLVDALRREDTANGVHNRRRARRPRQRPSPDRPRQPCRFAVLP